MSMLKQALINLGDADDDDEAESIIKEMRNRVYRGEDPEEVLYEYGLEPDYVLDLLF